MRPSLLFTAILASLSASAMATTDIPDTAPGATSEAITEFDGITVVGTRSERSTDEVPATVTVIDRERIDREQSRDLKDLLRYEPGLSVTQAYGRFGIGDVRIRGLGGNRVQLQVDGIDIADSFAIGSFSSAGRDHVDPETLERVEILRGSASALYGSDALGGVVSFRTREPRSYIKDENQSWALRASVDGASDDDSVGANALFAAAGDVWSGLLQVHRRDGHETENAGIVASESRSRTAANPQDYGRQGLLAKLVREIDGGHRLRLALDTNESDAQTTVFSLYGPQATGSTTITTRMAADDEQDRQRFSLGMEGRGLDWRWADGYEWQLYRQDTDVLQATLEERATLSAGVLVNPSRREREFTIDQRISGIEALMRKSLQLGAAAHDLAWGVSWKQSDFREMRNGRSTNLVTNAVSSTIFPDVFPVRDFPVSTTRELGVYVQDEIRLLDGRLAITPALRWDRYELEPRIDDIFAGDNPGIVPVGIRTTHVSPKLALGWKLAQDWNLYASWSEGFRAPPYNDANLGFTNFASGYTAIPNPDLRPETSRGLEWGVKGSGRLGSLAFAVYHNRYHDFIESLRAIGVDPNSGLLVFQSQNIADVEIRGVELQGMLDLAAFGADGWRARASLASARGEDRTAGIPLASIDPARAVLGIGYDNKTFGVELVGSFAKRKSDLAALAGGVAAFRPSGYGVFDLLGQYRLGTSTRLDIAVLNLGDKVYWEWSDVPGIAASSTLVDRYTRPGRGFRVALNHSF